MMWLSKKQKEVKRITKIEYKSLYIYVDAFLTIICVNSNVGCVDDLYNRGRFDLFAMGNKNSPLAYIYEQVRVANA